MSLSPNVRMWCAGSTGSTRQHGSCAARHSRLDHSLLQRPCGVRVPLGAAPRLQQLLQGQAAGVPEEGLHGSGHGEHTASRGFEVNGMGPGAAFMPRGQDDKRACRATSVTCQSRQPTRKRNQMLASINNTPSSAPAAA